MSSLTTWSPNSFQLRLAFSYRKSPAALVKVRLQKLDHTIRSFSVREDGSGRRRTVNSWVNFNSSVDNCSGWSSADSNEQSGDSQRKPGLGGIAGATAAGVVLIAGLSFAVLSLGKSTSRPTQQMDPLSAGHQALLSVDDPNNSVQEEENDGKNTLLNNESPQSWTGIDTAESSSYVEKNELANTNKSHDDTDLGYTLNGNNVVIDTFNKKEVQNESAIGDVSVAPEDTPQLFESDINYVALTTSNLEDTGGNLVTEKLELDTKEDGNHTHTEFTSLSTSKANPTIQNDYYQEDVPGPRETANSDTLLDSSASAVHHISTESLGFNVLVNSQLDAVSESQFEHEEDTATLTPLTTEEDLEIRVPNLLVEVNKSSMSVNDINGGGSSRTTLMSAVANPFANEQDENGYKDINRSRSNFDTTNAWNFFSFAGVPAPSLVPAALQVLPGKVLVPAVVDQIQGHALAALQVLKVVEADVQPSDLCTRREYARWLVLASSALSRSTVSKVYPAMYIENVTELAFDDITPEDPDFSSIQGLAEAGLISSKLSNRDMSSVEEEQGSFTFYPESPLSRQDLVSWKISLEKRQLPVVDKKILQQLSGFLDVDKIDPDAWPALVTDLSAGEQGIIALAFGYTRLFQPDKPVTKAQAAIALATGEASDIVTEELARIEAESMADKAVSAHNALVAQVEKDINASFEKELLLEREKIDAVEKLAHEARQELEKLRSEREEENVALIKGRAAIESEMEVLSQFRRDMEEQLQSLMSNKLEIKYEKERLSKLQKDAEKENQEIARLQYELEVERKALSMARAWAEDEAKRAREQGKALEEARGRWERQGIKVVVDNDLHEEANAGVTWLSAGQGFSTEGTVGRAENLVEKLKAMATDVKGKSKTAIDEIIQKILLLISKLKEWALNVGRQVEEQKDAAMSKMGGSFQELQLSSTQFTSSVKKGAKRVAGDCREGVQRLTQKFKT